MSQSRAEPNSSESPRRATRPRTMAATAAHTIHTVTTINNPVMTPFLALVSVKPPRNGDLALLRFDIGL